MKDGRRKKSIDEISFGIIANAGDARSYAFQALDAAKSGNFDEAEEIVEKIRRSINTCSQSTNGFVV